MTDKTYSTTLEIKVVVEPEDLTFGMNTQYHNKPNYYVQDVMNCLMFKIPQVVRAGWSAFEKMKPNIEDSFSYKIIFDFESLDDEWYVSAKVDNPDEIGRTLIGISQRILTDDPVIDEIIKRSN